MTTYDFGRGPVPAKQLDNKAWVADSAMIHPNASVCEWARVGEGASVGEGARVTTDSYSEGRVLAYQWASWIGTDAKRWLRYGCEMHLLTAWTPKAITAMCKAHVTDVKKYEKALKNLVAYVRTISSDKAGVAKLNAEFKANTKKKEGA